MDRVKETSAWTKGPCAARTLCLAVTMKLTKKGALFKTFEVDTEKVSAAQKSFQKHIYYKNLSNVTRHQNIT